MKCVVSGSNIKILAKAIHALAKIGDEMYVQPQEDSISFRTVSMSNSAFVDFTMFKNYFSYYTFGDLQDDDALKCKISMRCAMGVFKASNVMDKVLETCHINLEPNSTQINFILKYKNSIIKTHRLPIIDSETIKAAYKKDGQLNHLSTQARVLLDVTQNFTQNLVEITLEVTPQKVLIRNYIDESPNLSNITRTQIALGVREFDEYTLGTESSVSFCLKEFKAILAFAEIVNLPINLNFETAGKPVVFVLKNPSFEANLVLATVNPDVDSQSITSQQVNACLKRKRAPNKRTLKNSSKSAKSKSSANKSVHGATIRSSQNQEIEEDDKISISTASLSVEKMHLGDNQKRSNETEKVQSDSAIGSSTSSSIIRNNGSKMHSIFPVIPRKKSKPGGSNDENEEDIVPGSPPRQPSKKARLVFQKCFKATFDPRMLPGHDEVLAEDSDEEK